MRGDRPPRMNKIRMSVAVVRHDRMYQSRYLYLRNPIPVDRRVRAPGRRGRARLGPDCISRTILAANGGSEAGTSLARSIAAISSSGSGSLSVDRLELDGCGLMSLAE